MPQQIASSTPSTRTSFVTPSHPEWSRLNFPHRLHHLLASMEAEGLCHIAHWDEHGLCFTIRKSDELIQNFLPFFFQQRKWKSFQRQMNIYSFKRIPSGPNKGYYCHPFFKRSDISMARKILRKKQKSELSSEAWIRASQDYSCPHPSTLVSPAPLPLSLYYLCSPPRRHELCSSGRARTSAHGGFSLNDSSFDDEEDHPSDALLGYQHIGSTIQDCPGTTSIMEDDLASSSFTRNKEGVLSSPLLRPLVLVPESSDSDESGAGFSCYDHNLAGRRGVLYGQSVMDDPGATSMFQRAYQDEGEASDCYHPSSLSSRYHTISEIHYGDRRSVMMVNKQQRVRGVVVEEPQQEADSPLLDNDDESIATIDDLTGLTIFDIAIKVKDDRRDHVVHQNNHELTAGTILSTLQP